jgi:hypothetical protein
MKVRLESSVPTVYQLGSIRAFGIPVQSTIYGSFHCEQPFQSVKDAKLFLFRTADKLAENEIKRKKMYIEIKKYNSLSYDAAIINIVKDGEK